MRLIGIFLLLAVYGRCLAQKHSELAVYPIHFDHLGTSVGVDGRLVRNRSVLYGGLSYLINPPFKARYYGAAYANKAFASYFIQRFTLNAGYEYSIRFKDGAVRVFPFMEFGVAETGIKSEGYSIYDFYPGGYLVSTHSFVWPARSVFWIVGRIGVGSEIKLSEKFGFVQRVGVNPAFTLEKWAFYRRKATIGIALDLPYYAFGLTYKL